MFLSLIHSQAIRLSIHKPFGLLFYYFYEGRNLLDNLQVFRQKICNNYKIKGNLRGGWEERKDRKGGKDRLSLLSLIVDLVGFKALKKRRWTLDIGLLSVDVWRLTVDNKALVEEMLSFCYARIK